MTHCQTRKRGLRVAIGRRTPANRENVGPRTPGNRTFVKGNLRHFNDSLLSQKTENNVGKNDTASRLGFLLAECLPRKAEMRATFAQLTWARLLGRGSKDGQICWFVMDSFVSHEPVALKGYSCSTAAGRENCSLCKVNRFLSPPRRPFPSSLTS